MECNGIRLIQAMRIAEEIWTGQLTVTHADRRAIAGALKRLALSVDPGLLLDAEVEACAEKEGYFNH